MVWADFYEAAKIRGLFEEKKAMTLRKLVEKMQSMTKTQEDWLLRRGVLQNEEMIGYRKLGVLHKIAFNWIQIERDQRKRQRRRKKPKLKSNETEEKCLK